MRINNNNFQKNANISLVSRMVWRNPGISRVEIARELSLYRSTVTSIVSSLLEKRVVIEGEEGSGMSKGGRKPITLRLNDQFGCILGFDIQPSHYRTVVLNLCGDVLWHESGSLPQVDFDGILDFLMGRSMPQVLSLGLPLLAVCAGVPGIVDADREKIIYAEPFKLHDYDFHAYFKKRYHVLAFIENDANCTTWLELALNRNLDLGDFISIIADYHEGSYQFGDKSGIGVGIGLCVGKKVYAGSHHASGEICTFSWREGCPGQSGLPRGLLIDSATENEAWNTWMNDFFSSMVPVLSVIDPQVLFIHGKPFEDESRMEDFFSRHCPQFPAVLKKIGCRMVFNTGDDTVVAKGAAMMFLERLFSVPELSEMEVESHFSWNDVFAQAAYPMKKGYKKGEDFDE
jgi:hypothetical protein